LNSDGILWLNFVTFGHMKIIKIIFWSIWRIWFFLMIAVIILLLWPLLFITTIKESWYPHFFFLARIWAKGVLLTSGFYWIVNRDEVPVKGKSYMFVANHTSITDVMLMLATVKNPFVFVGKKELAKLPLFGFFYKRSCILVDRSSQKSRMEVFARAQKRLNQGLSICIFPEGGVPANESILLDHFKDGAFRLAIDHQIPIVPMAFADNKKRFSYTFFSGSPGRMRVKMMNFISTDGLSSDNKTQVKELNHKVWGVIHKELLTFENN
jgi:1-acyl-sn-glycerol-3-phosphate acyltransferase